MKATINISDLTDAEMALLLDIVQNGPNVDFDPDQIRDHAFDAIVDFVAKARA